MKWDGHVLFLQCSPQWRTLNSWTVASSGWDEESRGLWLSEEEVHSGCENQRWKCVAGKHNKCLEHYFLRRQSTGLCKDIAAKFRESPLKRSAAHPKIAQWQNISAIHSWNMAGMFLHDSVQRLGMVGWQAPRDCSSFTAFAAGHESRTEW